MRAMADRRIVLTAIVFALQRSFSLALERRVDSIANGPHPAFGHLLPRGEGMMRPLYEITTPKSGMSQKERNLEPY